MTVALHPNCRPKGNMLALNLTCELGLFEILEEEELVLHVLSYFNPIDLLNFGKTCKKAFIWSTFDELWKNYCLKYHIYSFNHNWRQTFTNKVQQPTTVMAYNDLVFNIYRYANCELPNGEHTIPMLENATLSEFEHFERENLPCILKGACKEWPAYSKWTWEYLIQECGDALFQAESIDITIKEFSKYALGHPKDEACIYLFDKHFKSTVPSLANDFKVPDYFKDDYFSYLNNRPDYCWLIAGPERSGSTFHKDPNMTSAWNATIRGRKLWIMTPPNKIPPGIFPSKDGSTVTTPLSLMDWYTNYRDSCDCIEGISEEGDVVFIPHGWFHSVINLEPSIAITQNYVGRYNLCTVLKFLKNKTDQISGIDDSQLFDHFLEALDIVDSKEIQSIIHQFKKKKKLDRLFSAQQQMTFGF